jgi:formate dehydrogenase alpha subunit
MARMVTLTIDGVETTVPEGTTILDAAETVGIKIPTLCHDKRLIPFGSCRICVVQVKGKRGKLMPSCFNPVRDGMEILTASPEVIESRKTQLQLMLLHHPLECPTCDQAGACALQDMVYEYGVAENPLRQVGSPRQAGPVKEKLLIGSMAVKERDRCILCGRCVRMCEEVQGVKEIDFISRGFMTKIGTDFDRDLDCEFCGQCVSTCPVGALTTTLIKHKARHWELKKVKSVCAYCGCGCALLLGVKDDQLRTVISEYETGANHGNLCVKGRYGWEYIHSKERLSAPLIRKDGKLVECTWDEALKEITAQFKRIKDDHGPDALAAIGSARLTNEEGYLLQKFMRAAIGTNNLDNSGRFSYEGLLALNDSLGYPAMTNSIDEIGSADVILALRSDLRETHPLVKIEVIKALSRNKAKLINANNVGTWLDEKANLSLVYRPGTEVALINGIIRIILEEGLEDKEFISSQTVGLEALRESVGRYDLATVERITGIPGDLITRAARMYAQGERSSILIASGLSMRGDEAGLAQAAANLALLTGNVGRESTGVSIMGEKNNSQGLLDMGVVPDYLPGFQEVGDDDARKKCALTWMVELSSEPGLDALAMLKSAGNKKVKALYIVGENPVTTYPDRNQVMQALEQVDFLVVQDLFLSETAKQAHVVLPVVSFSEKEGTFTSIERRVQRLYRTINPRGVARSDFDIIQSLSNSLGYVMNYSSPAQVMEEINQLVAPYAGVTYGRLGEKGLQWPCTSTNDPGSRFLYEDGFPAGRAVFKPVEDRLSGDKNSSDFPYTLVTVQSLCHSGSFSLWSQGLKELGQEKYAELNAGDAKQLKVESGDVITITSSKGTITVPSKITERTPPGRVIAPYHFGELKVNLLTDMDNPLTPVGIKKA